MRTYDIGQNFDVVVSTKATLFGASSSEFTVHYAPTTDLTNKTLVSGGMTEAVTTIASDDAHSATLSTSAGYGARKLYVDSGHNIVDGDVIQYATGKYAYVVKAMDTKLYLRTRIRSAVASGDTLTQVGNTGVYSTPEFGISEVGEYLVTIESPEHGMIVESRIAIKDLTAEPAVDTDEPDYADVAVAY